MPGFATSARTLGQAHRLMKAIGCQAQELDIRPAALQMLRDIGHPYARGEQKDQLVAWEGAKRPLREFMIALLLIQSLLIGTFCALDLVLFYVLFEAGQPLALAAISSAEEFVFVAGNFGMV